MRSDRGRALRCVARGGRTLVETAAAMTVLTIAGAALVVGGERTRSASALAEDVGKLRQIGSATWSHAADNEERVWGFSWKAGPNPDSPFGGAPTDVEAAADEAVWLMRTLGGRGDIPRMYAWAPHPLYSHLPLLAYMGQGLPNGLFVSTGDAWRHKWAKNPACFEAGCFRPYQPWTGPLGDINTLKRWPYSASFQLTPAFWNDTATVSQRISQHGGSHNSYAVGAADLGQASLTRAAFPSQKVMVHDAGAWHFGARAYSFLHPEAVLPVLTVDGHVQRLRTADANPGWRPLLPTSPLPSQLAYEPSSWEPATTSGNPGDLVTGVYRWTRGGIAGRDFGGPEVNTGHR